MEALIGIFASPGEYATRLAAYVNSRRDVGYGGISFQTDPELDEFLNSGKLSILLTDDPIHLKKYANKIIIYLLSEDREKAENDASGNVFYKYLPAGELLRKCLPGMKKEHSKTGIYTVFSPSSNLAARNFAHKKAEELSLKGRTLLMNWDPFGAFGRDMQGTSISELLFAARKNRQSFGKLMSDLQNKGGFYTLKGTDFYSDLWQFNREEMESLIGLCREEGDFSNIVFECAFMSEGIERLMEMSDEVIIPKVGCADPGADEFLRQMKYAGKQDILSKIGVTDV